MHNSDQVRDFFQKMANGLVLNSQEQDEESLQLSRNDRRGEVKSVELGKLSDFGVGLPPLAHSQS